MGRHPSDRQSRAAETVGKGAEGGTRIAHGIGETGFDSRHAPEDRGFGGQRRVRGHSGAATGGDGFGENDPQILQLGLQRGNALLGLACLALIPVVYKKIKKSG